jgi:hypothetical protein
MTVLVAKTAAWELLSLGGFATLLALVVLGGGSLALVLRALDEAPSRRTRPGDAVGRSTSEALERLARIGRCAEVDPEGFGPHRVRALERAIARAREDDVAPWIPAEVLGRAELLFARATARCDVDRTRDVSQALRAACEHLRDPRPAVADLELVQTTLPRRAAKRFAGPEEPRECDEASDEEPGVRATVIP